VVRALLAVALLVSACGDDLCAATGCPGELPDAMPGWPQERTFHLPTGALLEAGLDMRRGDSFDLAFESDGGPVVWDIHIHDGDDIRTDAQGTDEEGMLTFVAPETGTYWSSWLNFQPTVLEVRVSFTGHGSTEFRGWL
jgi:hypothetical protein